MTEKFKNKKVATVALAGILAMGAFSAAPAFAGNHAGNGCSAAGCGSKTEKSGCKGASGCKSGCESKSSCKSKSGCEGKSGCKSKNECKSGCKSKSAPSHEDNARYND